ncbi:unnamed protein product [Caenorhabditis angaria]|uniref:Uncharacterized protein n=1 Tax=Caenorhabditis angaria TaxID=860376 RepID=A0A9P1J3M0_9PELO|nr:unnamed protein product [Caenorhabditis angaria]
MSKFTCCRYPANMIERIPQRTNILYLSFFVLVYLIFEAVQIPMSREIRPNLKPTLFEPTTECFHKTIKEAENKYSNFAAYYNRKNTTHYSPITPFHHQALIELTEKQIVNGNGKQVTFGNQKCNEKKNPVITNDTPLRERALCKFEYMLNYNPNRLPAALTEAKCVCPRPNSKLVGRRIFKCQELKYQVRVLLWDEACQVYKEHVDTISLACLPVIQAAAPADADEAYLYELEAEVPTR